MRFRGSGLFACVLASSIVLANCSNNDECSSTDCRRAGVASVRLGDGDVVMANTAGVPIVSGTDVYMFAGEIFAIEASVDGDGNIVALERVTKANRPASTIGIALAQEEKPPGAIGTSLVVQNPFDKILRYELTVVRVDKDGQRTESTVVCPVQPHTIGVERWDDPILAATLSRITLVPTSATPQCSYAGGRLNGG